MIDSHVGHVLAASLGVRWCGRLVLSTLGFHFAITKPFLILVISFFVLYDNWNIICFMRSSCVCLAILYHAIRVIGSG